MKKEKCLIEGCNNIEASRGVCTSHYYIMGRAIKRGNHSWEEFEEYEMSRPKGHRNWKNQKLFLEMLKKKSSLKSGVN